MNLLSGSSWRNWSRLLLVMSCKKTEFLLDGSILYLVSARVVFGQELIELSDQPLCQMTLSFARVSMWGSGSLKTAHPFHASDANLNPETLSLQVLPSRWETVDVRCLHPTGSSCALTQMGSWRLPRETLYTSAWYYDTGNESALLGGRSHGELS